MNFKIFAFIFCLFPCLVSSQKQNSSNNLQKMSYEQLYESFFNEKNFEQKSKIVNYYRK